MKSGTVISIEEKQQFLDQSQTYIIKKLALLVKVHGQANVWSGLDKLKSFFNFSSSCI